MIIKYGYSDENNAIVDTGYEIILVMDEYFKTQPVKQLMRKYF